MSVAKIKRSYSISKISEHIDEDVISECVTSVSRKLAIAVFIVLTNVLPIVNNVFTLRLHHDNKRNTISS
jgi:hypothetical protein